MARMRITAEASLNVNIIGMLQVQFRSHLSSEKPLPLGANQLAAFRWFSRCQRG